MINADEKRKFLESITTDEEVISELFNYTENKFSVTNNFLKSNTTSEDVYISTWKNYKKNAETEGVFKTLKKHLVQLQFPIKKEISLSQEYKDVTLKGVSTDNMLLASGVVLNDPENLHLEIYECVAGKVPALIVPNDEDFCSIINAFSHKNEPVNIPKAMGAAMIKGINNWNRINTLKEEWLIKNPFGNWNLEFKKNILPNPYLYKDKLIVLSKKPYSSVLANELNISEKDWIDYSIKIRLEHECTHLFTLKYFKHMANNMHDELLADYIGISKALGKYQCDWFLKFIGLENFPEYRDGARLENYLGNPPLSEKAVKVLRIIIKKVTNNLASFDKKLGAIKSLEDEIRRIGSICMLDLITIALPSGAELLLNSYQKIVYDDCLKEVQYGK